MRHIKFIITLCLFNIFILHSNNSYRGENAWLNYRFVEDSVLRNDYKTIIGKIFLSENKFGDVIKSELKISLIKLLGLEVYFTNNVEEAGLCIYIDKNVKCLRKEGFLIKSNDKKIILQSFSDEGLLYGVFYLIRKIQCHNSLKNLNLIEIPQIDLRMLNHWDDIDGNIERGYAGKSLWKWTELPEKIDKKYYDYARLNASIGINGVVLNNVNADPRFLRDDYLMKISALAEIFRKYNIRIYITANFASPIKPSKTPDEMKAWGGIGDLDTADPGNENVQIWWKKKIEEIYRLIPDFGGFLIKANSEGMPGPQDYNCSHADGANMLARLLKPYGGFILWRTFVYNKNVDNDRMKRSYKEFKPLDGQFEDNVILQTKNGPLDFQVIEPPQPLFGAMKHTNMAAELQITQEYTGHSTYLVYLLPLWKWFLRFDTYCEGKGSTISKILKGNLYGRNITAIAGVANTGSSVNWTGHHFAQANWFAYGKLAWNPDVLENSVTIEWIKCTWSNDIYCVETIKNMMCSTWKSFINASSPYGLGLTMDIPTHYRADFNIRANKEWQVDNIGIGNDRSDKGSNFVSQYYEPNSLIFNEIVTCPEDLLLSFHYVEWNYIMKSGNTLKDDFFYKLKSGIFQVKRNIYLWKSLEKYIDYVRYEDVLNSLICEKHDATRFYCDAVSFFYSRINMIDINQINKF